MRGMWLFRLDELNHPKSEFLTASRPSPVRRFGLWPARAAFSATGEINRLDFGVCFDVPIAGLASEKARIDVEAEAVLRMEAQPPGSPPGTSTPAG
jgi:hypothetical protein